MESRIRRIFLNALAFSSLAGSTALAPAIAAEQPEQVVRPEIERREVKEADIDTEDFEVGAFFGLMNVQDFGTNVVYGARAAYHVTEHIFVEAAYGHTDTDETSAERLGGNLQILADEDRELDYYNLSFGLNLFPGEAFLGSKYAFTSDFYLIGGVGWVDFAGEEELAWNFGFGYRLLATDWLAIRLDARDHIFENDVLGESDTNHNLEFSGGLSIFF